MPIATLSSLKKKEESERGGSGSNSYYNGGASRQGGSSTSQFAPSDANDPFAAIVGQARSAASARPGASTGAGVGDNVARDGAKQLKVTTYSSDRITFGT